MNELVKIEVKSKDIRKPIKYNKTNCFICNKHKGIAEWHHLKPLKECAKELNNGHETAESKLICLCPNCHSYFHKLLYSDITEDDRYILLSLWGETKKMRQIIINLKQTMPWI